MNVFQLVIVISAVKYCELIKVTPYQYHWIFNLHIRTALKICHLNIFFPKCQYWNLKQQLKEPSITTPIKITRRLNCFFPALLLMSWNSTFSLTWNSPRLLEVCMYVCVWGREGEDGFNSPLFSINGRLKDAARPA